MKTEQLGQLEDPRIQAALAELEQAIAARYPVATFDVFYREDPDGVRLRATIDVEDTGEVIDTIIDTLYEIQVERGLPIYVIAVRPMHRVGEQVRARMGKRRRLALPPLLP